MSFAAAARLHAEEVQDSHRTKRRRQREDMEAACATQDSTLHGPLLLSFSMPQPSKSSKETTATVYAVNPLALLCRLTAERPEFGDLLKGLMQGSEVLLLAASWAAGVRWRCFLAALRAADLF